MLKNLRRRHLYAWILLGVFLPMLVMASVHVHTAYEETAVSCPDCVHHVHHDGHLSSTMLSIDHCVLCHFLAFNYLQAAQFVAVFLTALPAFGLCYAPNKLHSMQQRILVPRGPPATLLLFS